MAIRATRPTQFCGQGYALFVVEAKLAFGGHVYARFGDQATFTPVLAAMLR